MLKKIINKRPFFAGLVTGIVGIGILGGYLKRRIGKRIIIVTAIIDGDEPGNSKQNDPENPNREDPEKEKEEN